MPARKTLAARPRKKKIIMESPPVSFEEGVSEFTSREPNIMPEFSPSPRFYRTIAISFLGLAALLVLAVILFTMGKAEISLILKPKNIKIDALLNVALKAADKNQIPGLVLAIPVQGEKVFAVEGEGTGTPSIAAGRVTIFNNSKRVQPLVATTRLLTPENVLFRIKKNVVVPAGDKVEVEVGADKPGAEGNIKPSKFIIPGLPEYLQKSIYAESFEAMTGGVKYIKVLNQSDIEKAQNNLWEEIYQKGQTQLKAAATASSTAYSAFLFSFVKGKAASEAKTGSETDKFLVRAEGKMAGVFFAPAALAKFLTERINAELENNEAVAGELSAPALEINKYDAVGKTAEIRVAQNVSIKINYLEDILDKPKILGQKKEIAEEYLKSLPWIEKAEIKTSPSWFRQLPKEMGKIKINIKQ
ncbi:MAG: hypothetical protein HY982_00910 [Candidatus Magasanikbacteria bacterium]|nr:hypothetical protein [Candidatus Magasanikbacteria bacterium]